MALQNWGRQGRRAIRSISRDETDDSSISSLDIPTTTGHFGRDSFVTIQASDPDILRLKAWAGDRALRSQSAITAQAQLSANACRWGGVGVVPTQPRFRIDLRINRRVSRDHGESGSEPR